MYDDIVKARSISMAAAGRETTERLLDTAERLFGAHGYDGVGMRALAEEAKVNLGAATYHFGSKEALYIETFMRRFRPTNVARLKLLREAEAEAKGRPLTVERIVDCMIRPPFLQGLAHPNSHALLARNLLMPPPFLHAAIHRELKPNVEAFITALRRSLPGVPKDMIHFRVMFSMGSLLMFTAQRGAMGPAHNPKFDESILKELVRFVSAGVQSKPAVPAADWPPPPRPPKRPHG
jgi:AcrR family transcriptional regulator